MEIRGASGTNACSPRSRSALSGCGARAASGSTASAAYLQRLHPEPHPDLRVRLNGAQVHRHQQRLATTGQRRLRAPVPVSVEAC
ncbi:hypothetical protein Acsp04_37170 [Actinomadura sp. NBRC 104425]|nr:hypothetical protein Acsp04_37170 [Actinomadura sp. NBRC 104425]